jgi:uncharacterized protein DUF6798
MARTIAGIARDIRTTTLSPLKPGFTIFKATAGKDAIMAHRWRPAVTAAIELDIAPDQHFRRSHPWTDVFAREVVRNHLLFTAATLFVVLFYGYHFGTFDQVIHIPALKKFADSTLYPGDAFMELRLQHYSFFWLLFVPFYRLGVLPVAMFITHLLVTYSTFWVLWALSDLLFHNRLTNLLCLVALAFPHATFGGWTVFEFSLLNRTFVLPFLLLAVILFLRRRYLLAFALLGLLYNLHAISTNFALGMILFDCLVEWRRVGWRTPIVGMIVFIIAALPVLLWKLGGPGGDFSLQPEWFSIITRGVLYNNYYLFAPYLQILLLTAGGVGAIVLFFVARRYTPPHEHDRAITIFVYALLLILLVQMVTTVWLPLTLIVEAQLIRAGVFVMIFGYLYFANYLVESLQPRLRERLDWGVLTGIFVFSLLPFIPALAHLLQQAIPTPRGRRLAMLSLVLVVFASIIFVAGQLDLWHPGIHLDGPQTPWYDVQIWARDHTPNDTIFITPPYIWSYYESDWRVFSERSTVVSLTELLDVAFAPDYTATWVHRFETLAPGALAQFSGDNPKNGAIIARAFYGLADDAILRAACQYHTSYLVIEKPHLRPFPRVYQNQQFVVYSLPYECKPPR